MKVIILSIGLIFLMSNSFAQESREEKINYSNPVEEYKENNPSIPEGYSIKSNFDRIIVLRFKYQTDLMLGLDSMVKSENIKNAVILSGIGSVTGYHIHTVNNRTFPSKDMFIKNPKAPADILNVNGYVINGRVHAHITLADKERTFGGHLEPGTQVFTFAVVTLGVLTQETDLDLIDSKHYR